MVNKLVDYVDLDYKPNENDLIAMYYVEKSPQCKDLEHASMEIAKESSIGTWTAIATMSTDIANRLKPSVFHIDLKNQIIKIAYTKELFEADNMSQILSAIAGNIYGMKALHKLRLLDITFPKDIIKAYKGPKFGIDGIRKLLNVPKRPLLNNMIKPCTGHTCEVGADLLGANGLIDVNLAEGNISGTFESVGVIGTLTYGSCNNKLKYTAGTLITDWIVYNKTQASSIGVATVTVTDGNNYDIGFIAQNSGDVIQVSVGKEGFASEIIEITFP